MSNFEGFPSKTDPRGHKLGSHAREASFRTLTRIECVSQNALSNETLIILWLDVSLTGQGYIHMSCNRVCRRRHVAEPSVGALSISVSFVG